MKFKNTIERILHVKGNYGGGILEMAIVLDHGVKKEVVQEVFNYLTYGNFISAVINFAILAFVVFWIVKIVNKIAEVGKKKEEEEAAPPPPPEPTKEEVLLTEIRDLLKEK